MISQWGTPRGDTQQRTTAGKIISVTLRRVRGTLFVFLVEIHNGVRGNARATQAKAASRLASVPLGRSSAETKQTIHYTLRFLLLCRLFVCLFVCLFVFSPQKQRRNQDVFPHRDEKCDDSSQSTLLARQLDALKVSFKRVDPHLSLITE